MLIQHSLLVIPNKQNKIPYSPFYGYHEKERLFLKIYLYNPALIKRLVLYYIHTCGQPSPHYSEHSDDIAKDVGLI